MSHCVDESYDVYSERRVRARKRHACCACREPIEPGHVYMRVGIVFGGQAYCHKRCLRCQKLHEHLRWKDTFGDTWPAERLDCGQRYEDEWGELPEGIAALAFQTGADFQAPTPDTEET